MSNFNQGFTDNMENNHPHHYPYSQPLYPAYSPYPHNYMYNCYNTYNQPPQDYIGEINFLRDEVNILVTNETTNVKKIAGMESTIQLLEKKIKQLEDEMKKQKTKGDNKKHADKYFSTKAGADSMPVVKPSFSNFMNNTNPKQQFAQPEIVAIIKDPDVKISMGEIDNMVKIWSGMIADSSITGEAMQSLDIGKLTKNVAMHYNKPENKTENNEEIEDDVIDPNIVVEDIGKEIRNIDDLIELGKLYDRLKVIVKTPTQDDMKQQAKDLLANFDMNEDEINNFVGRKNIKIKPSLAKKNNGLYEINGKYYSINLETLNKLVKPLTKLKNMIGLNKVKESIMDMILYYLQNFEKTNSNMLHTVIEGPPGTGKTEIGRIIGEIYSAMGVIKSDKFKVVRRTDLIGEYVGHTAHKTQRAIDDADGGVLFIDEAYSLGSSEGKDTFSKECIDTLNQNLSENKHKIICIIAGYSNELETSFFSQNPGLARRFPFRFAIDGYNEYELTGIFMKKIYESKWKLCDTIMDGNVLKFFNKNEKEFIDNADVKLLLTKLLSNEQNVVKFLENNMKDFEQKDFEKHSMPMINKNIGEYIKNNNKVIKSLDNVKELQKDLTLYMKDINKFFTDNKEFTEYKGNVNILIEKLSNTFKEQNIMEFFRKHLKEYSNFGGDIDTLLLKMKMIHSRRMFGKHPKYRKQFNNEDIEKGFSAFLEYKKYIENKRKEEGIKKKEDKKKNLYEQKKEDLELRKKIDEEEMSKHISPYGIYT